MTTVSGRGQPTPYTRGREDGPVRSICEVLAYRKVGAYHQLTIVAPDIAARATPGQFVSLAVEGGGTTLRRPFSIAGVSQHGPWAGTIDVVLDVVGPGTAWLAGRGKHDVVDVVGPLGRGFPLPRQPATCLLVGGGYGAAPLLYLAGQLQHRGHRVDLLFGAKTGERIFNAIEGKRQASSTRFTTEDGSFGTQGVVTDVLPDVATSTGAEAIYACGPMGLLAAVAAQARERRLPCQVSVEELMGCGVGVCNTCVVPYRRRDGLANVRACYEGPVLDAKRVVWEAIGSAAMTGEPSAGQGEAS